MESKPEISVPESFNETQIFALETPEDVPFFEFKGFKSECNNYPPIMYSVSLERSIVTEGESSPYEIVQNSPINYQIRVNLSTIGTYNAFIIAQQGQSTIF